MPCAAHSLVSACVLLMCAAIAQAVQGHPDPTTVTFLLVGVTSVIHHCRLNEWWKRDVWRWLDYAAIAAFTIFATLRFGDRLECRVVALIVVAIASSIWSGRVPLQCIPAVHAAMHVLVATAFLVAILQSVGPATC